MAELTATIRLDIRQVLDWVWLLRQERAQAVRDVAEAEVDPRVAHKLSAVATAFEMGQRAEWP